MAKASILSMQKRRNRQRSKSAVGAATQANRLMHTMMNQLTVIYLSCAKLRHSLEAAHKQDAEIQIIESAVAKVASQLEALRFRIEKSVRATRKTSLKQPHKNVSPGSRLTLVSASQLPKM